MDDLICRGHCWAIGITNETSREQMDTVGDAYVVAALLPPVGEAEGDDETSCKQAEVQEGLICSAMLEVT